MSMREYAVNAKGLLLNNLKVDGKTISHDILEELVEEGVCTCTGLIGETFPYDEKGRINWNASEHLNDEMVYYIDLPRYESLFRRAYKDMAELVRDMKRAYDKAREKDNRLPKLTLGQVQKNIRDISGIYYG